MRLIQVSTDCVFSGRRGAYSEEDIPDPVDLYGRSKLLGELDGEATLTLRTSMIGRELERANGLLEWFLGEAGGSVRGFTRAVFSGPTTPVLSRAVAEVIETTSRPGGALSPRRGADRQTTGSSACFETRSALEIEIEPDDSVEVDRSLDSSRFREATGWEPPSWAEMVAELGRDGARVRGLKESLAHR